ncbi:MAG: phage tail sheath C-terminal domain-containing protein [Oculatellaceae cyanobacterium bins.114]|nr:phage tail sheath C-terminal domain-containing protein [Oculatellaceae cyanobacterium bins.114]
MITGVATSITAFVGRTLRGPINEPITINNYGDFERIFGGLWVDSTLSYAVRDFFLNGGSQAIIVRLFKKEDSKPDKAKLITKATEPSTAIGLLLVAANPGEWGNSLRARIDHNVLEDKDAKQRFGLDANQLFNLTILDAKTGFIETFQSLTVKENHPRRVDRVLENESQFVRVDTLPTARPNAHAAPPEGKTIWNDENTNTYSKVVDANLASNGTILSRSDFTGSGLADEKKGLYTLNKADLFKILCIPPHKFDGEIEPELIGEAAVFCQSHRAFLIIDPPLNWKDKKQAKDGIQTIGTRSSHAAVFFPRLIQPNPLRENQLEEFAPCGVIAGIFARTDAQRGVWKAAAGLDATLVGVSELSISLSDAENGELNPLGINCLRTLPAAGRVVWGARTLQGDDRLASEWKYIPVRRLALYIEESLYRGTQWIVFEPNDEALWAQIRLNVGAFMNNLFRQGAFQGKTPREAYVVKCDRETTTQTDINSGIVNIVVGFAPLKPAEFVIIKIQQLAGQIST